MTRMRRGRAHLVATVLAAACLVIGGCSSGSSTPTIASSTLNQTAASVQSYLDAVNKLCDDLLPKVIAVTHGGSFDIPLKDFFAQLPAHTKLRDDFDASLASIPVPTAARSNAAALAAYIRFANQLDAKRLAAAKQGATAYAKEIGAEKLSAANDPSIAARNAAGFHDSCDAR